MTKTDKSEEKDIPEVIKEDNVTISKSQFDELLSKINAVESKVSVPTVTSRFPLKTPEIWSDDNKTKVAMPEFRNKSKNEDDKEVKYTKTQRDYLRGMTYYEGYPDIRGGRVVTTNKLYENDDTYSAILQGSAPRCLCGACKNLDTLKETSVLFVPHRGVWLCPSDQCVQQYIKLAGGFERLVSRHLFANDTPPYGTLLSDPNDPMQRRGLVADIRQDEFND